MADGNEVVKAVVETAGGIKDGPFGWLFAMVAGLFSTLVGIILKQHKKEMVGMQTNIGDVVVKFNSLDGRVDNLERVLHQEFTPLRVHERHTERIREDVIALHKKIESGQDMAARRHEDIMNILLERREARRGSD